MTSELFRDPHQLGLGFFSDCPWKQTPLGELLREPLRQGFSAVPATEPTGHWILSLGALTVEGLDPNAIKPVPLGEPRLERCRLRQGDVLVSRANCRSRVGFAATYRGEPEWCAFPDLMMRLRPERHLLDADYLMTFLRGPIARAYFERMARGTSGTMVKITGGMLERLPVAYPPLTEQKKIADLMAAATHAVHTAAEVVSGEKKLRMALLRRLMNHGIGHSSFYDTPLGDLPANWRVETLGELCTLTSGGTPSRGKKEYWNGAIPWVKTGELGYGRILRSEETISSAGLAASSARLLPEGTLLLAMYGQGTTRGKVSLLGIEAAVNQACLAILEGEALYNEFLCLYLEGEYGRLRHIGPRGGRRNLSATLLRKFQVPVPPKREQEQIIAVLSSVAMGLRREEAILRRYREIRQGLLGSIFSFSPSLE
jgi:type I restriction enzyme S subunit